MMRSIVYQHDNECVMRISVQTDSVCDRPRHGRNTGNNRVDRVIRPAPQSDTFPRSFARVNAFAVLSCLVSYLVSCLYLD